MRDVDRTYVCTNIIEIMESLNSSAIKAGGMEFGLERLKSMTAFDLLTTLCTNNIRFQYTGTNNG